MTEPSTSNAPKPEDYATFTSSGQGLSLDAAVTNEGRISLSLHLNKPVTDVAADGPSPTSTHEFAVDPALAVAGQGLRENGRVPRLSVVIMIVGSRGDVQPFLALGKELARHGHRVRVATHGNFREFVTDTGLEFFDIGGDPAELMSYMVRNPGLMPGWASLTNGDIGRKRKTMRKILDGCWKACFSSDGPDGEPFAADAIISNPPSFAHIHCAEALGIPLLMSFTMPWSVTTAFPHPLVNISKTNATAGLTNYFSYALAELLTWQGLGDIINKFRERELHLPPLPSWAGAGILDRLKVPWTYCFSPQIVPKPEDWTNYIDVVGFYFLDLATGYTPPPELATFLAAGPPPIYIGFGSVVVERPDELTQTIFEATRQAGVRALVSPGWGGIGGADVPEHIFILGNVPHDWLFQHVTAVCHHGGAGTMAIGLRLGKPTIIVPFFGDQPFWGAMVHRAGAGPKPIRKEKMGVERLANAIKFCLTPEAQRAAEEMGVKIRASSGLDAGVHSFHRHLPLMNMRCDLCPERVAVWWSAKHCLRLSAYAAQVLHDAKLIALDKLELHRPKEYASLPDDARQDTGSLIDVFHRAVDARVSLIRSMQAPIGPLKVASSLITEPYKGAKKDGFKGFIKGTMVGYANVARRPVGFLGAMATKAQHGVTGNEGDSVEDQLRSIRARQGLDDFASASHHDRASVAERFRAACTAEEAERRRCLHAMIHEPVKRRTHRRPLRDVPADPSSPSSSSSSFASASSGLTLRPDSRASSPEEPAHLDLAPVETAHRLGSGFLFRPRGSEQRGVLLRGRSGLHGLRRQGHASE